MKLTLPTSYDAVVTAIQTLSDDTLSLAFVKTRLLDYEIKLRNESVETSAKVLQTEVKQTTKNLKQINKKWRNFRQSFKQKPYYHHSREFNPSNNQNFKGGQYSKYNTKKCEQCGRKNHEKKNCFYFKKSLQTPEERQRTIQNVQIDGESGSFAFMTGAGTMMDGEINSTNKLQFILDSGATDHLVNQLEMFTTMTELEVALKINIAKNNEAINATKKGTIQVTTNLGVTGILENVLYAPDLPYNLLSVCRIQEAGMCIIFSETGKAMIKKDGKTILTGKSLNNLICVNFIVNKNMCNQLSVEKNTSNTYKLWHERLGHIEKSKFLEIKRNDLLSDSQKLNAINPTNDLCEACIYGKQARLPFSKFKDRTHVTRPLFIIHTDVCGPIKPSTIDDKNYFVTFIDEFTHYTVVYLLNYKSEVFEVFQDFVNKSEVHFNLKIVYLYCDNGNEYLSNEFKAFCVQKGIQYHLTVPYSLYPSTECGS